MHARSPHMQRKHIYMHAQIHLHRVKRTYHRSYCFFVSLSAVGSPGLQEPAHLSSQASAPLHEEEKHVLRPSAPAVILLDAAVLPGSEGAPIYDAAGLLVGVSFHGNI